MKLKHITEGTKELTIGLVGEFLNGFEFSIIPGEYKTHADENMLPHSYTLAGLGKILHNKKIFNNGRILRRKARQYSRQKSKFYKEIEEY